jgi:hypothetical protein
VREFGVGGAIRIGWIDPSADGVGIEQVFAAFKFQ